MSLPTSPGGRPGPPGQLSVGQGGDSFARPTREAGQCLEVAVTAMGDASLPPSGWGPAMRLDIPQCTKLFPAEKNSSQKVAHLTCVGAESPPSRKGYSRPVAAVASLLDGPQGAHLPYPCLYLGPHHSKPSTPLMEKLEWEGSTGSSQHLATSKEPEPPARSCGVAFPAAAGTPSAAVAPSDCLMTPHSGETPKQNHRTQSFPRPWSSKMVP